MCRVIEDSSDVNSFASPIDCREQHKLPREDLRKRDLWQVIWQQHVYGVDRFHEQPGCATLDDPERIREMVPHTCIIAATTAVDGQANLFPKA